MRKLFVFSGILLCLIFCTFRFVSGQIVVSSGSDVTPVDLVETILGEGLQYSNVQYHGADSAKGIFSNGQTTNLGLESGIILTSGRADSVVGPNSTHNLGVQNYEQGYPLLTEIATGQSYDACVLEFDFIPEFDTLRVKYVFGSEDYNEWVGGAFNDVFGLFVSGPDPDGGFYDNKNIAIVPGTVNTSIAVNNINNGFAPHNQIPTGPCTNCQYFSDNTFGLTLQYDGLTTVLIAWLKVTPYEQYHLILGVADVGDLIGDAGVFLEENSIECKFPRITTEVNLQPPGIWENMVEEFIYADITFNLLYADEFPITFDFELSGTADPSAYPPGDFEEEVPSQITFEEGEDSITIQIKAVYDGLIEGDEFLDLIIEIPYTNYFIYDTLTLNILDYVEMNSQTSPNTMICEGQELDLWVQTYNGFPPYTYLWDPGGFTTDTITVYPDTTTKYYITVSDIFTSITDSIQVTVFPDAEIFSFSFETSNNPILNEDITGEISEDSIALMLPIGTIIQNLIATFEVHQGSMVYVNNQLQTSGETANDFSLPITYVVITPWGCMKEWVVNVDVLTEIRKNIVRAITISPNPASDKIAISNAQENELFVLNNLGEVVLKKQITDNSYMLDVRDLIKGVYYFQFRNYSGRFVEKVVINR